MNVWNQPAQGRLNNSPSRQHKPGPVCADLSARNPLLTFVGEVSDWQRGWAGRIRCGLALSFGRLELSANRETMPLEIGNGVWIRAELVDRHEPREDRNRTLRARRYRHEPRTWRDLVGAARAASPPPRHAKTAAPAADAGTRAPGLVCVVDDGAAVGEGPLSMNASSLVAAPFMPPMGGSSTWRESFSRPQLEVVFRRAGLDFVADRLHEGAMWRTPSNFGRSRRIDEIAQRLNRYHQGQPFAIVDDTHSGASLMPALQLPSIPASDVSAVGHSSDAAPHPFAGRVVLCEENVGLSGDHIPFIVAALRQPVPTASASQ